MHIKHTKVNVFVLTLIGLREGGRRAGSHLTGSRFFDLSSKQASIAGVHYHAVWHPAAHVIFNKGTSRSPPAIN